MVRATLTTSTGAHRAAFRRVVTTGSVALLLLALYEVWPRLASCPQPAHPKPGEGYACDPSGPTYHHPVLWLLIAATSVVTLVAARRLLSDEAV